MSDPALQLLAPDDPGLGRGFPENGLNNSSSDSSSDEIDVDSIDILLRRLPSHTSETCCGDFFDLVRRWRLLGVSVGIGRDTDRAGADRILK